MSHEYHIFLDHDAERRRDTRVVQVESQKPPPPPDEEARNLRERLVRALRKALLFRLDVEFLPPGPLERTTLKARRVTDYRRQYVR